MADSAEMARLVMVVNAALVASLHGAGFAGSAPLSPPPTTLLLTLMCLCDTWCAGGGGGGGGGGAGAGAGGEGRCPVV